MKTEALKRSLLLIEVNGFSCLHPEDPFLLMDFRYAERYPPGKPE